mgnify:FL=1
MGRRDRMAGEAKSQDGWWGRLCNGRDGSVKGLPVGGQARPGLPGSPDAAPQGFALRGSGCDEALQGDDAGTARPSLVGAVGECDANR